MKKNRIILALGVTSALVLTGCGQPVKVTGGGTMHSAGGSDKVVFTFNGNSCDENKVKGQVNFHDKSAIDFESVGGVKLYGEITSAYYCSTEIDFDGELCACDFGYNEINFNYRSTNSGASGEGQGIACLADFGEGKQASLNGLSIIQINSGPFSGYYNAGNLEGNVQYHACPGNEE